MCDGMEEWSDLVMGGGEVECTTRLAFVSDWRHCFDDGNMTD